MENKELGPKYKNLIKWERGLSKIQKKNMTFFMDSPFTILKPFLSATFTAKLFV